MKNIKLNRLILISFILIALVFAVGFIAQYKYSNKATIDSYVNQYKTKALNARDEFRLSFDKTLYKFKSKEKENLQKLDELYEIYKRNDGKINVDEVFKQLNKSSNKTYYNVSLINKNHIIEKSSNSKDIGIDFKNFDVIVDVLDSVFDKKVKVDISPVRIDTSSMSMIRYFLRLSHDEKYLLQIAYEIPIYKDIKENSESLNDENTLVEIYIATPWMMQQVDYKTPKYTKVPFESLKKNTEQFLEDFTGVKYNNKTIDIYEELLKVYKNKGDLVSFLILDKNKFTCSFIANGVFKDKDSAKLIVQLTYSTDRLKKELNKGSILLVTVLIIIFAVLFFIYSFIKTEVSDKTISIINSIKKNQESNQDDIKIDEIKSLQNSYNNLHKQLNKEISTNKKLLADNKRFIADTVHQIKTPLSNIVMNSDMIKINYKDDGSYEFLEQIDASITMLTNSYEDLSYITSHDFIKYKIEKLNLSNLLGERIEFFETISKVSNKQMFSKIQSDLFIQMNITECERLIDNNISNAIKYADFNKEIKIELYDDENIVVLNFSSYGQPIKNPKRVFEKDYRENEAKRGLGLGLNMVKGICEKYMITYSVSYKDGKNIFSYVWHK